VISTRTKSLFLASALSPLSILIFLVELKLGLTAYSRSKRFELFHVPYQNVLEALFFVGIFAFTLSIFSLVRDNRTRNRIPCPNK
jgi:type IV secretory pathway TrbL component